jgi:hypothetical protein
MSGRIFFEAEAAAFLTAELKAPVKASTLRAKRRDGTGPKFGVVFNRVEYREEDLTAWVEGLRKKRFTNTAQAASGKAVSA